MEPQRQRVLVDLGHALGERVPREVAPRRHVAVRARSSARRRVVHRLDQRARSGPRGRRARPASRWAGPSSTFTNDGGPPALAAITGTPQAIASTNTCPNDSLIEGMTITSEHARPSVSSPWPRHPTKNTSSTPSSTRHRVRVLALPLAGEAAPDHQRRRPREPLSRPRVGANEERHPLDLGEAPHEQQHRRGLAGLRVDEPGDVLLACRPRCPGSPPSRHPRGSSTSHSRQRARRSSGVSSRRSKRFRSTPLGTHVTLPGSTPSSRPASSRSCGEITMKRLLRGGPAAHLGDPVRRVLPLGGIGRLGPARGRSSSARCRAGGSRAGRPAAPWRRPRATA